MKAVNVSVTLVIVLVALYCTVWFGRSATRQTVEDGPPPVGADVPTLTKIGPLPKAVIPDGRLHNFSEAIIHLLLTKSERIHDNEFRIQKV